MPALCSPRGLWCAGATATARSGAMTLALGGNERLRRSAIGGAPLAEGIDAPTTIANIFLRYDDLQLHRARLLSKIHQRTFVSIKNRRTPWRKNPSQRRVTFCTSMIFA